MGVINTYAKIERRRKQDIVTSYLFFQLASFQLLRKDKSLATSHDACVHRLSVYINVSSRKQIMYKY